MIRFFKSLSFAIQGITFLLRFEKNAKIQTTIAILTIALGFWLKISNYEWIICIICIGIVLGAEAFNTAIENLCNLTEPNPNPKIKTIKDLSASAVLIVSMSVAFAGIIIFLPKFLFKLGLLN